MVAQAFSPSSLETGHLCVQGQPDLHSDFQDSQGNTERRKEKRDGGKKGGREGEGI